MNVARILITLLFLIPYLADARHLQIHGHKKISIPPVIFLEVDTHRCQSPCPVNFKVHSLLPERLVGDISHYVFNPDDGSEEKIMTTSEFSHTYENVKESSQDSNHHKHGKKKGHYKKKTKEFKNFKPRVYAVTVDGVRGPSSIRVIRVKAGESSNQLPVALISGPTQIYQNELVSFESQSYDPDGVISLQEWQLSDGRLFQGGSVQFSFPEAGTYDLNLVVTDDKNGVSSTRVSIEVLPLELDVDSSYSIGHVELSGFNPQGFNARSLQVVATAINATFKSDLSKISLTNSSGRVFSASSLSGDLTQAIFNIELEEGKNELELDAFDSDDKILTISNDSIVWAGSRTLTIRGQEFSGEQWSGGGEVAAAVAEALEVSSTFEMEDGVAFLENIPERAISLTLKTPDGGFGFVEASAGDSAVTINMLPNRTPSDIDNDDFSQGANGWEIVANTNADIVSHIDNDGAVVNGNNDLEVYASAGEVAHVGRTIVLPSEMAAYEATVKLDLVGAESMATIVLRNETSNQARVYREYSNSSFSKRWKTISIAANAGDIVHFDMIIKGERLETSWLNELGVWSVAYAQANRISQGTVDAASSSPFAIDSMSLSSWHRMSSGQIVYAQKHDYLSIGQFPDFPVYKEPGNIGNRLFTKLKTSGSDLNLVSSLSLELVQETESETRIASLFARFMPPTNGQSSAYYNRSNYSNLFTLNQEQANTFDTNENHEISAFIRVNYIGGYYRDYPLYSGSNIVSPISLIPLIYDFNDDRRYPFSRNKDISNGGDSWTRTSFLDWINDSQTLVQLGFNRGDYSKQNGGFFPGHSTGHNDGLEVDFATSALVVGSGDSRYFNEADIAKLANSFEDPNFSRRVEYIYGAYSKSSSMTLNNIGKDTRFYNSPSYRQIRAKCSADYRVLTDVLRSDNFHYDHLHMRTFPKDAELFTNILPIPGVSADFAVLMRHQNAETGEFNFEISADEVGWDKYFWEIYKYGTNENDKELVEVIDDKDEPILSSTIKYNQSLSNVGLRLTPGEKYVISVIGVKRNGGNLAARQDEKFVDSCVRKRYKLTVPKTLVCGGAPVTQVTQDPESSLSEDSLHQDFSGPFIGVNVTISADTLIQAEGAGRLCAGTVIEGTGGSSGTPAGSIVGEEEIRPALRLVGEVELANTYVDLNDGRLSLFGQEDMSQLIPPRDPAFFDQYVGLKVGVLDSVIRPTDDREIVITNSHVWDRSFISGAASIQTSWIRNSDVLDETFVGGATIDAVQENAADGRTARVRMSGPSIIVGSIYTADELNIHNAILDRNSDVSGQANISDSIIRGYVVASENITDGQVAEVSNGAYIGERGALSNQARLIYAGIDQGEGGLADPDNRGPSHVWEEATVWGGVVMNDNAFTSGKASLGGAKTLFQNSHAWGESNINSNVCNGTQQFMHFSNSSIIFDRAFVCGTPDISGSHLLGDSTVTDNAKLYYTRLGGFASVVESAQVIGNSADNLLDVGGNASIGDSAIVSGNSAISGNTILHGTVKVYNCILTGGGYGSGSIHPGMEDSPCANATSTSLAFATFVTSDGESTEASRATASIENDESSTVESLESIARDADIKAQRSKDQFTKRSLSRRAELARKNIKEISAVIEARKSPQPVTTMRLQGTASERSMTVEDFDAMKERAQNLNEQIRQEWRDRVEIYKAAVGN